MGQEQSVFHKVTLTPGTTLSSQKSSRDEQETEQGIIRVVSEEGEEQEEELELLQSMKQFEPFFKEQEKGFGLDLILGSKNKASSMQQKDILQDPMVDLFFGLQGHVKEHMSHIHMEQRILLKRIAYADELSSMAVQTMTVALNQAKLVSEKIAEAPIMKQQAIQIQNHATHIFKALSALEEHLDPEDRISAEIRATRWPELNQLLIDAAKPMIDRYISSSSDLATVGTTSTSPLVEHMITNEQEIETSALSRLRGLSSRSLSKTDE